MMTTAIWFLLAELATYTRGRSIVTPSQEARELVNRKRAEAENWYRKNVLKLDHVGKAAGV